MGRPFSRREFVRTMGLGGAGAVVVGGLASAPARLSGWTPGGLAPGLLPSGRNPLNLQPGVAPSGLVLHAAPGMAHVGGGVETSAWMLNGSLPSPLLRARRGDIFDVRLQNDLPDPLILHWHGLTPPEDGDGHPRLAVPPGSGYSYRFPVENRAGTYWYHSHTHHRTAEHTYRGIGGLLLVEDDDELALDLPSGERELPIVLQDRRLDASGRPVFGDGSLLEGYLGDQPFGNGTHRPGVEVDSALYRLRILNASNARIFQLARSDNQPLILIGTDGGLLDRPVSLPWLELAPAERADLLLDLRSLEEGDRVDLISRPFQIRSEGVDAMGSSLQGSPMDLVEFHVSRKVFDSTRIPALLVAPGGPDPARAVQERVFHFTSELDPYSRTMMLHLINGHEFRMDRVDEHVPFGQTEIWSFTNDQAFAHPVHLHGTHFRVLSRTGGRGRVMPWEGGLKDTVLLHPLETVRVAVEFTAHRGLFPLHCHVLEHEDVGMMLNILVE